MSVVFQAQPGIRWVWLYKHHPTIWEWYMDGVITKFEAFLLIGWRIV